MRLADEFRAAGVALAEREHGIGRAAPAHLVVEPDEPHVVGFADRGVIVDAIARHGKQRDAVHAGGRARQLREHEVHDGLGQLVVAAGDPHLGARKPIAAVLCCRAWQRMSASEEPACGSERHIVPVKRPASIGRT